MGISLAGGALNKNSWAYASVNFGFTLLYMAAASFLMYYYTDVAAISTGAVSAILLIARLFDVAIDPFIGYYMDGRSTKYGKFKGYIYYWALPSCVLFILLFLPSPFAAQIPSILWRLGVYLAWSFCYSMIEVSNLPLLAVICKTNEERHLTNTLKVTASIVAVLAVSSLALKLVSVLGGGFEARGFGATATLIGVCAFISFFYGARYIEEKSDPGRNGLAFLVTLREVLRDKRLVFLYLIVMCDQIAILTRIQSAIYYLKYYVGMPELLPLFFLSGLAGSLSAQPFVFMASKRRGILNLMISGYLLAAAAMTAISTVRFSVAGLLIFSCIFGFSTAFPTNLIFVYTAELSDSLSGKRNVSFGGIVNSLLQMASKIGFTIAGSFVAFVLHIVSYSPNVEQSALSILGIKICFLWFTTALLLLCALFAYLSSKVTDEAPDPETQSAVSACPESLPMALMSD